jgi:predicted O-methyltransferase YrrM
MIETKLRATIWKALRHYATDDDLGCLRRLLPSALVPDAAELDALFAELTASPELLAAMDSPVSRAFDPQGSASARQRLQRQLGLDGPGRGRALLLYITTRVLKPDIVVETGCFTGWDSAVILQALDRNGRGHLHTIDLPARDGVFSQHGDHAALPDGLHPGFLVPDAFKPRWSFTEGNVRDDLMPLLARLGAIDVFFHDSDHTYAHMMWEYAAALPHIRPGGLIVSDDIAWNTAFWDFAASLGAPGIVHRSNANVGAIKIGGAS